MLNVGLFYYDRFANHEVVIACHEFRRQNIISLGIEKGIYESTEKQKVKVDASILELKVQDLDVLIIPGGFTDLIQEKGKLLEFIRLLHAENKYLAGICGGTFLLAESGILDGRRCTGHFIKFEENTKEKELFKRAVLMDEDVVVDGRIITARGKAFIEFALVLARRTGLFANDRDYAEEQSWLKNRI